MSRGDSRVLYVPAGGGESRWVFGDKYTFKADAETTGGAFSLLEAHVPAEAGPPPHVHEHSDEAFYLLEGAVQFTDGEEVHTVEQGGFIFVPRGSVHGFKNLGPEPAKMLAWFTPGGTEGFFKALGVPAVEGAPPPGRAQVLKDAEDAMKIVEKFDSKFV
ncbi:quercetin 2,3-dioxygenase [Streptomyces luteolus]|uniref:Quercetin 2,3-dioxygenase n=1 Tax=Streptomyces luteolus TaxID=3043615 RepID=A0ABT6T2L5_9ACTN|nr:quercetin 2,3-dioxygenase [Streptomyces sp. B-S-A12]MDI3422099.1 quercetin 2,3-dioxygenase [Streptomyces sp. B-S-A12]